MVGVNTEVSREIHQAFSRMKVKDYEGAEKILQEGLQRLADKNPAETALYHSTLGVLSKLKGDAQEAWRHYEHAERLLPDDPSLKIITAKLLIDRFAQYDTAIKKLKEALKHAKGAPSFEHQAHATMAIAHLKKGEKKKAVAMFDLSVGNDFEGVSSAENLNFEVIEAFLSRNFEVDRCKSYIQKSLSLAKRLNEERPVQFLTKLLASFEVTLH